jgi:protease-4
MVGGVGVLLIGFYLALGIWGDWHDDWSGYNWSVQWEVSDGWCNIAVLPIMGDITSEISEEEEGEVTTTNADEASMFVERANSDENILGLLVRIDSYGGAPVASEIVTNAVKRSGIPIVALIREAGTSGGYMIASAADTIIASAMSDIGSIGMTMSYVGNWQQNAETGLTYVPLTSAPFKDYMHPDKPLTDEERKLLERDLAIYHEYFVGLVAENRGLSPEHVAALADGSSMPGALALEAGLIDQLGDQETARAWFAQTLEISADEVVFCE